jgi:hypothetical protein
LNIYEKALSKMGHNRTNSKKRLWLLVKAVNNGMCKDDPELLIIYMDLVKTIIGDMTPSELMNIFPVEKFYKGEKYECKDYFTTMELMNEIGNEIIADRIDDVLYDYHNLDIRCFNAKRFSCIDAIRRSQGKKSMMEEFLNDHGIDTHYLRTDSNGKEYMISNKTSRTHKIIKNNKFKVIKGCKI